MYVRHRLNKNTEYVSKAFNLVVSRKAAEDLFEDLEPLLFLLAGRRLFSAGDQYNITRSGIRVVIRFGCEST
jgi:hypothetical protein